MSRWQAGERGTGVRDKIKPFCTVGDGDVRQSGFSVDYLVPTVYQILTQTQPGTSWMASPCLDRHCEFINSKCLPGNPSQDQILAKTSLTWLSILHTPTHRSALWVTALSDKGLS